METMLRRRNDLGFMLLPVILIVCVLVIGVVAFVVLKNKPQKNAGGIASKATAPSAEDEIENKKDPGEETGLIVHLSFDDPRNLGGQSFGASLVDGVSGKALAIDGVEDYFEADRQKLIDVGKLDEGTISLWFKFNKGEGKRFLPILYFGKDEEESVASNLVVEIGHYDHGLAPDTKLYYTLYGNQPEPFLCFDSGVNLEYETWYHFATVTSKSGNTGYLNGIELADRNYNFGNAKDSRFFSSIPTQSKFSVGHGWFGIDQKFHYFGGAIDEVKIYDRPLSQTEIIKLAN